MKRQLAIFIFLGSIIPSVIAQNAPVTTLSTISNATPGNITVPVTVTSFSNIGAISLTFNYDHGVMHFLSGTKSPLLVGSFAISDNDLGNGQHQVVIGWFGAGVSLPNGASAFDIQFQFLAGVTLMEWYDNGGSCEYADGSGNVLNDIPASTYYINGYVCGSMGNPGTISGLSEVCLGQSGVIYSITPLPNASSYNWSVPAGAVITSGNNTHSITVDYSFSALSGYITVSGVNMCTTGPSSQKWVNVHSLPTATISGGDSLCDDGSTTILSVDLTGIPPWTLVYSDGVNSYSVSNVITTPYEIITGDSGVYTVTYVADAYCVGETFGSAEVLVFPIPPAPVISIQPPYLTSNACCGNQWYCDDVPIPGATGQTHLPWEEGFYTDIVTLDGCSSPPSNAIYVLIYGVDEPSKPFIKVFPNPAGDYCQIVTGKDSDACQVEIYNNVGIQIGIFRFGAIKANEKMNINLTGFPDGAYFLAITAGGQRSFQKLVILR